MWKEDSSTGHEAGWETRAEAEAAAAAETARTGETTHLLALDSNGGWVEADDDLLGMVLLWAVVDEHGDRTLTPTGWREI